MLQLRSIRVAAGTLLFALGCGSSTPEEPMPTVALSARVAHAMVYDEARHVTLLLGGIGTEGSSASTDRGSLWTWDGHTWTKLSATGPSARHDASLSYDANRQRVVLHGGRSGLFPNETMLTDTWEWNGTAWTRVADTGPSARVHQRTTYDRARNRTVLYGGFSIASQQELRDIWEWNGTAWSQSPVSVATGTAIGVAYDEKGATTYLLTRQSSTNYFMDAWNGTSLTRKSSSVPECVSQPVPVSASQGNLLSTAYCDSAAAMQTWRFDGTTWTRLTGAQPAGPRINFTMSYDRDRDRVVLFGGESLQGVSFADTWEWDGTNWTKVAG